MGVYIKNVDMPTDCGHCDFFKNYKGECYCYITDHPITFIGEIADDCPLIEIVRCKDCKHYDTESRSFPCCTDIFGAVRYMEADGFCSKGERRADDD